MNKLIISGRLTRDAEARFIPSGTAVMSFTVANNTGFGEKQKTHFFDCSIFGKRAEGKLKDYMLKGQQVVVEGEISLNQYQKKDGTGGASLNVFVNNVELMGSSQPKGNETQKATDPAEGDDLPF
ncbi:MAG: single-stranded DNA-binding protein [Candidatus Marinimicrobia bacterium]|jgi:single-strand DNA-binding protein|nr:single-stranded DNA-binding protein [Candidatus Neomarinimicrobiota bacterium]MBT5461599.1 single-stranded DNA-binding protein [Candidatus Neomarinimicrobiota bacterium]MBT7822834.1 single-stranded DNA-binding protein [Candidatus Neomarinimicrobiota bacterium]